ncbi:Exocyst complex component EXO84 [Smittium culicis]|uniref:Exocyst complex component EXO84 n=1 Tax=Smittium culicis TaxID=133412 RepID=A0A1R1YRQ4_9FUNG|nr:Exocyst complex component EXO84 [Smittium culicis]
MLTKLDTIAAGIYSDDFDSAGMSDSEKQAVRALRRRTVRMTVQNQQNMHTSQMNRLWSTIEGSQRLLPFSPNRHIIGTAKKIEELSPLNFQFRQFIQAVILNDSLLIVAIRKRGNYSNSVLVADRCMRINEITIVQLEEAPQLGELIKIINKAESYLLRFSNKSSKAEFLSLFEKAISTSGGLSSPAFQGIYLEVLL